MILLFLLSVTYASTSIELAPIEISEQKDSQISKKKLEQFQYTDVMRALKSTPGVYAREEEGQGLRPNIGLRGTNPDRSKKIVLLEDGILIGPAPYSAPAAYYTPNLQHSESLKIYKGFEAQSYGPNSIGGAIEYISPSIARENRSTLGIEYGSFGQNNLKAKSSYRQQQTGTQLQLSRSASNGFKKLDNGGDTGFEKWTASLQAEQKITNRQNLQTRLSYSKEDSHESYLGLSESDYAINPYRRYNASALDRMQNDHWKIQAEHFWSFDESNSIRTSIYHHRFQRTWYRLDRFRDGSNIQDVLKDPESPLYEVLTGQLDSEYLGSNGELILANNDRRYVSQGVQSRYTRESFWENGEYTGEFFLRFHEDSIERRHDSDRYLMSQGNLVRGSAPRQIDLRNKDSANALSLASQNTLRWGRFSLLPRARTEFVRFRYEQNGQTLTRSDRVFLPGIGIKYQLLPSWYLRTSVNQAATLTGLDKEGKEAREQSWNYEFGSSWQSPASSLDLGLFWNNYQNITGTCSGSNGCQSTEFDTQFNGGKARIYGLEAALAHEVDLGRSFTLPLEANFTWMRAAFQKDFISTNAEWGKGLVQKGDPLPYIPQMQYSFHVGLKKGPWRQELAFQYQSKVYDQSAKLNREEVRAYGLVDFVSRYEQKNYALFAKVDNLLAREYEVSLRPFGLRPGKPRSFSVGISYKL